jgi:uracil-DNA glycosylase
MLTSRSASDSAAHNPFGQIRRDEPEYAFWKFRGFPTFHYSYANRNPLRKHMKHMAE